MYGKVNDKTDVYSFGVVLLELITGRTPIDTSRPKGQENLVTWASPLLEERNLEKLVDPQLKAVGMYDLNEMESMVLAASLCVQQSAPRRPSMSQVLKILCGDQSEDLSIFQRQEARLSVDLDDTGCTLDDEDGKVDIQTHMALAMLGVDDDDDVTSQCSTDLAHSNVFLEEYLEGRFTRSSSFDN
jgi:serine/threonine protein kinase